MPAPDFPARLTPGAQLPIETITLPNVCNVERPTTHEEPYRSIVQLTDQGVLDPAFAVSTALTLFVSSLGNPNKDRYDLGSEVLALVAVLHSAMITPEPEVTE